MSVPALLAAAILASQTPGAVIPQLPDGLYLNLPEAVYFAQGRGAEGLEGSVLGSTDLSSLWLNGLGWWWGSANNPFNRGKSTKAQLFGSATHALLLEGEEAFNARFAVEPNPLQFPDLIKGRDALLSALTAAAAPVTGREKVDQLAELAKVYLKGRHVWEVIDARFKKSAVGREVISFEERWKLQVMLDACMKDELMRSVVTAGQGVRLSEVSVFWTLPDGVRIRFRFDTLLPQLVADLKTLYGGGATDMADAIGKRIGLEALDVQAAMSFEARRAAYRFIEAGQVYGGTVDQLKWLARFPSQAPLDNGSGAPGWSWLWLFYQKADAQGVAPTMLPLPVNFGSTRHRLGFRKAMKGLAVYREQVAKVGLKEPWTRIEPVYTLEEKAPAGQPRITIPHWIKEADGYAEGEEEAVTWRS